PAEPTARWPSDVLESRKRSEPRETGATLLRSADSGQYDRIGVREVGAETLVADDPPIRECEERAHLQLTLAQLHTGVTLDDFECGARRREEELVLAGAE